MSKAVWFTVAQVAEHWGITADEVRKLIRSRRLGHMRLNPDAVRPTYRISETHIAKYERENNRAAA